MKKRNLNNKIISISIVSAVILVFAYHIRYSEESISMDDLIRTTIIAPAAAGQDIKLAIQKAATHNVSFINQLLMYKQYKDIDFYRISKSRIWNSLAAVFVVLMIFRIGTMCSSKLTGIISAFIFAFIPPSAWSNYTLQILIVLIHFELLIFAFKKNFFFLWIAWTLASILLFGTGIYAEPILLQFWFLTLLAGSLIWVIFTNVLSETKTSPRRKSKNSLHEHKSIMKKISEDSGVSRFIVMMGTLIAITFVFSIFAGAFVPLFRNPIMLFFSICTVTLIVFMLPNFIRERQILIKWYKKNKTFKIIFSPENTFISLKENNQLLNMCFAYSAAIIIFLPFLYFCHNRINIFINNWEVGNLISFISENEKPINWFYLILPVIFLIINYVGFFLKFFSREKLIGVSFVFLLSSVYIFQQRYAIFSTPFYVICVAGVASSIIELLSSSLKAINKNEK